MSVSQNTLIQTSLCFKELSVWSSVEDEKTHSYRASHLKSWVHQAEDIITVTGLQTNNVINDIIHLTHNIEQRAKSISILYYYKVHKNTLLSETFSYEISPLSRS